LEHRSSQDETELSALRIQLSAGDVLFSEGDPPTTAFLIESGEVVVSMLQHGKRVVLSHLTAGDLLGEMAVIDDAARTATAIAASDCVLFPIDREQITERLAATDPIIRSLLEGQLKRYRGALAAMQASDGLDVRYQPLLHVASGKIAGYEALVRWNHPERGPISPVEFVALAEETSLIVPVGEYVFDTACRAVQRFIEKGADPKPFVAVNVSARQLGHPGLIDRIVARVDAAGLPRGSLKVEITESQALNYELVAGVINLCHRHGIRVALDDFGTGYSHLTHLHRLPFDTLKVDQAFTHSMLTDPRSMAIVEAIIRMGKAIGADIVVEGIETPELLEALRVLDCDYAQGYLIGKPQTLEELIGTD
jgi:EAL domain-containing protein (putative c-di-GMP-specific phosphodiesterase class I)